MGLSGSIFRHTAIYSAANILGKIIGFAMLPFYAHIFQVEGYGIIAMIDTSLGLLTILLAGGFQAAILRIYHEQPLELKSEVLGTGIGLVWGLGFAIALLPFIFSAPFSRLILGSPEYYPFICLALLSFVIDVAGQGASTFLIIKERSIIFSLIGMMRLFLGLGLNIWLIIILQVGLIGVFISEIVTAFAASMAFHIVAVRGHGFGFNRQIAWKILRFQLPMLPGDLIAFLGRQAERILVRMLIGLGGMGILEMAYKFPPLLNLFINIPFQRAWRTKSIEIGEQSAAPILMGMMLTRYFFLMVFTGMILAVTIPQILMLMTPPDFWPAARISQVEIITTILHGCSSFMMFGILYRKQTKILSYMRITLTPLKIGLAFILISTLGLSGAAYSALIVEAVFLIWVFVKSQDLYPIVIEYWKLALILFCGICIFYLLEGRQYEEFFPATYAKTHILPGLVEYLKVTSIGSWKSGKIVEIFQAKIDPLIIMVLNSFFSLSFLALFPILLQSDPDLSDINKSCDQHQV